MADSDKTLIGDGNLSNNDRKTSAPSIVPSSTGTVHSDTHPTHHVAMSEPSTLKRKQTSFQITSVTVKGSRLSTDGGEDSADDLDESHTEDANSDILDCSRTTDVDNDQLSEECSNITTNDESSVHAPSIPVKCRTDLPVKQDAQINAKKCPSESSKDDKPAAPSERNQSQHVVNPPALPDQWQHRFRVVKIVSSEPFKRGRWLCMDFMDPPAPAVEAKPEVLESTTNSNPQMINSSCFPDTVSANRVAHIYEISPSDAYPGSISVAVGPDQIQQPMYGIFLPVNNGQYPFISGINTTAVTIQEEIKRPEPPQPVTSTSRNIQQSQIFTASQTTYSEAQTPFPCQQPQQILTTPASQKSAQPPATVQVCLQHQSQNVVNVPSSVTVVQQPAVVSAPVVPTSAIPPAVSNQPAVPSQPLVTQESQLTMQPRAQPSAVPPSQTVPVSVTQTLPVVTSNPTVISSTSQLSDLPQTVGSPPIPQVSAVSAAQTSSVGTQASAAASNIPEASSAPSIKKPEPAAVPSQVIQNHVEVKEMGTPPSSNSQLTQDTSSEVPPVKSDINGEDPERLRQRALCSKFLSGICEYSVPSGTSTVAIDNKIEQAMDLVKSHLMFAVREEVDVLKEKITELMDRISQLEYENGFLRANASQQTLEQLNQTQLLQQQQNQPSTVSINSIQVAPQPTQQQPINIQNPQSTS